MMWNSPLPRSALISSVAVIARIASAASGSNGTWLYPDPSTSPTFNYLDTLNASWASDFSAPWLHLWCGVINGNSSSPNLGEPYNETAPATGNRLFPLSQIFPINQAPEPFSCHFELSREAAVGLGPPYAMSNTFYVAVTSSAKPVTWSPGTANSSSAASTTATNAAASTTTASSSSSSHSTAGVPPAAGGSNSGGLSQGAKIGIGVGVALGVSAFIAAAAAVWFWLRRRKTARTTPRDAYGAYGTRPQPVEKYGSSKLVRAEMPADSQVHEKDSAPVATHTIGELEAPRY